jgi:hypothetical protein
VRTDYNPFSNDFDAISPEDLTILSSVAEGWYVEYKREVPNASAIAKSITAFANTYGGWIFYGIDEKSKDDPVAGEFPGIPNEETDGVLQRIRQAVANHAQPSPYFRVKALFGPVEAVGLPEGRCIIMGYVPWGPEAPYIHKDGRIYRRVGDGSEPRHENDRFVLDQLWKRSEQITESYAEWIETEVETSKGEENAAYVRLFLIADFWRDHPQGNNPSLREIRAIMSDVTGSYSIPFDNVYQAAGRFICRQTANNDPENLGLTWKIGHDFTSEIILPLSKFHADNLAGLSDWFSGYEHTSRFLKLCKEQRYTSPRVIDLNILFQVLLGFARTQVALAEAFGWKGPIFAKLQISGIWRTIPFIDAKHVLDEYEQHGMPLSLQDEVTIHKGKSQNSFLELPAQESEDKENYRVMMAVRLLISIAAALGIPMGIDPDGDGSDVETSVADFLSAGTRALQVQKHRAEIATKDY